MKPRYTIAMLLVCLLFIGGIAHAQTVEELEQKMKDAYKTVGDEKADHNNASEHLNKQIANFVRMHGYLADAVDVDASPARHSKALIVELV